MSQPPCEEAVIVHYYRKPDLGQTEGLATAGDRDDWDNKERKCEWCAEMILNNEGWMDTTIHLQGVVKKRLKSAAIKVISP